MGGRDNRKVVSFRASDQELTQIELLIKGSGLTKQDYLLKAALGAITHTQSINAECSTKPLAEALYKLHTADECSLHFEEGQVIDGQQNKTYKMLWASFEASQQLGKYEYHLSNKLGVICRVVGISRAKKKKLEVIASFPNDPIVHYPDGTFVRYNHDGLVEYYRESELAATEAIAEPTADVEPVIDEVVADAVGQPLTPINEAVVEQLELSPTEETRPTPEQPLVLTKKQFQVKYLGDGNYGSICQQGKDSGYPAEDGLTWFYDTKLKQWSTEAPQVSTTQLALVLV